MKFTDAFKKKLFKGAFPDGILRGTVAFKIVSIEDGAAQVRMILRKDGQDMWISEPVVLSDGDTVELNQLETELPFDIT